MRLVTIICMVAALIGCSKKVLQTDINYEKPKPQRIETVKDEPPPLPLNISDAQPPKPTSLTVYFEFNSSCISPEEVIRIKGVAYPNTNYLVYGACCPIGTDEYNIGLGTARANAVKEVLNSFDVQSDKIECLSYGETHLVTEDESQYHLNRRAEIYLQ